MQPALNYNTGARAQVITGLPYSNPKVHTKNHSTQDSRVVPHRGTN